MEVVTLLLFVAAVWALGACVFFLYHLKTSGHQHADRLALLPLDDQWGDPGQVTGRGYRLKAVLTPEASLDSVQGRAQERMSKLP